MILYTRLMLDILEAKVGVEEDMLDLIDRLPAKLSELYAERLNQALDKPFATKIFQWLVTCKRPPTVDMLEGVDTIRRAANHSGEFRPKDFDDKDTFLYYLRRDCLPLVEILGDGTVRLVHTTVSQFLRGEAVEKEGKECPALAFYPLREEAIVCISG